LRAYGQDMKKLFFLFVSVGLVASLLLFFAFRSLPDGKLHIFMLNIGQGDSILIQTPTDERLLIDGGPDDSVLQELGKVMPFYERRIEAIILTHPHADHVNGLVEVLKRYQVHQVMITGVFYKNPGYQALLEEIAEQHLAVLFAGNGQDYQIGNVTLDLLYPLESLQGRSFDNMNNSSIVFRLLYGHRSFYFNGDLEVEGETKLLASGLNLGADVLKVGHHGSRTSSQEALLDKIKPRFALISCGVNNKFHHPHPETLEHFQERGIRTFRTDLDGTIEVISDGNALSVKPYALSIFAPN